MALLPTCTWLIRYIHSVLICQHTNKIITLSKVGVFILLMKANLQSENYCRQQERLTPACFSSIQCRTNQRSIKVTISVQAQVSHSLGNVRLHENSRKSLFQIPNRLVLLPFKQIGFSSSFSSSLYRHNKYTLFLFLSYFLFLIAEFYRTD